MYVPTVVNFRLELQHGKVVIPFYRNVKFRVDLYLDDVHPEGGGLTVCLVIMFPKQYLRREM